MKDIGHKELKVGQLVSVISKYYAGHGNVEEEIYVLTDLKHLKDGSVITVEVIEKERILCDFILLSIESMIGVVRTTIRQMIHFSVA